MSSISFIDKKIEFKGNSFNFLKNLRLRKNITQNNSAKIHNKPEMGEVVTLSPQEKTLTYSKTSLDPKYPIVFHKKHARIDKPVTVENKNIIDEDEIPVHPDGPCFAELLGFGHSLRGLTPVFHAIKSIVTSAKKTISEASLPENLSSVVTYPVNSFVQNLSSRFAFILNSINKTIQKSFVDDSHSKNPGKIDSKVHSESSNPRSLSPSLNNEEINSELPWKAFRDRDHAIQASHFGTMLQNTFETLQSKSMLHSLFLKKLGRSSYEINGVKIPTSSARIALKKMINIIPNAESIQLISTYANEGVFGQAYSNLLSKYPEVSKLRFNNSHVSYKINALDKDTFRIVATNLSELKPTYDFMQTPYHSLGMRSSMIFSKKNHPVMKNAFFVR
ncbi:hypothetical protein BUCNMO_437 [Buchnera aphidicola (Nipponaphis monzeni)]|uniref:Uncharacterized protein n=1 Tax=Buchnera aphidicola (Nipponaphis monzeni) TaxID=2495405 RepID=A0A455TAS9_9GAMM|nr:hypothetical protein [Buchnera aphidicola]BBI01439.1 hypothetical protein BUCNMO_437 [Buchnera aphidicola (Nipponaphis monzeni)]